MSDIKLFRVQSGQVKELDGQSMAVEKSLQQLIEQHSDAFLGVRFLATEYTTGKRHGGRIDTLGIDENGCPVIIEYKRRSGENVINQGLFYLDWLMDHQAEFKLLVIDKFGKEAADAIEWSSPRLLCIAVDFTKYDEHAVQQINRNIELIRYRYYGELMLLELVNVVTASPPKESDRPRQQRPTQSKQAKSVSDYLARADEELRGWYDELRDYLLSLGDDVQEKTLKWYIAFRRLKNFCCVEIQPQKRHLLIYVKVDPSEIDMEGGFARDVSQIGHYGTGDLELTIKSRQDLEQAFPLISQSYEAS